MAGQAGDGVFQAALASYALFSDDQATVAELAVAAAVVLLPWSLLGPYAGVLLDRWSRRQVLLVGNVLRAGVLVALGAVVAADPHPAAVYGVALAALAVNRFLLAGLSAALPHTVPTEHLTPANAITPTLGTGAFVLGLAAAGAARGGLVGPPAADQALLAGAAVVYVSAGALALLLPRPLLGPDPGASPARTAHLVAGLVDALRHLRSRPWPAAALGAVGGMRFWFGLVTVSAVVTLRNATEEESAAVSQLGGLTAATAAGFLSAAVVTPWLARRVGRGRAVTTALLVAAVGVLVPATSEAPAAWWAAGALLGLGAQVTKICVDAVVQAGVDDDVRGRVFSLYDMVFNVAFVAAAGLAVLVLPASGRSAGVLLAGSVGLAGVAALFRALTRRHPAPPEVVGDR